MGRADFARELTLFRERAGLSVRSVAKDLGLSPSTVGGYFGGAHLPPVRLLPGLLAACGVADAAAVEALTEELVRLRRMSSGQGARVSPYRGLACFEPEQADVFFGREEVTARLYQRLDERRRAGRPLVVVVGPSGSGKSSVLRAGLVPLLGRERGGGVVLFPPRAHPLTQLATPLAPLAEQRVARIVEALWSDPAAAAALVREPLA